MNIITFKGKDYPAIQSHGFASQYAFAFAEKFCKGNGLDIGYSKVEWKLKGAIGVDDKKVCHGELEEVAWHTALELGDGIWDYIFSSHCLEHLPDYVEALDYWSTKLKTGGVLFLYLPNMDYQQYWQPENNRKHLHYISPKVMRSYFNNRTAMWGKVIVTEGYDLNGSFYCLAERI